MNKASRTAIALGVTALACAPALAWPDLRESEVVAGIRVFADHDNPYRYYFTPGSLELARAEDGTPDLHFLQLRYTGTQALGDAGERGSLSTLTLRVRMAERSPLRIEAARQALRLAKKRRKIELRPLPVAAFESRLVFASVDGARSASGGFEATESGRASKHAFWSERVYTVSLDADTSQLLWGALQEGRVLMSLAYVFTSRGIVGDHEPEIHVQGLPPDVANELQDLVDQAKQERADPEDLADRIVATGALGIRVDAQRYPELFQRIDFNEELPPAYAHVQVYCYDFKDSLDDAFYKKVEIEAEAVGGRRVPITAKFLASEPDLYKRTVRFPVPVHLDRPFRYRVTRATRAGKIEHDEWHESSGWGRILDITRRPAGEAATVAQETEE